MKKLTRKLPAILVVAVLIGLIVYGFWPAPIEVDAVVVERGSFDVTVNDDGETQIREKYIVKSPVAGKMLRVELHEGDAVVQGETVLARIDPRDPEPLDARSRAEAVARIRAAEAAIELSAAHKTRCAQQLELAKHEYDRGRKLIEREAITASDLEQREHEYLAAQIDLRSAEFSERIAEFERELAQAALVRSETETTDGNVNTTIAVVSPINGRVLRVFTEDAGVVEPGTPIMELGDPRDLEMKIDVLSTEAVQIRPGATVYVDFWGGKQTLEGIVRVIEPAAFLKVSALGVEEKRVNVIADFLSPFDQRQTLGDGFRIEAKIVVAHAENVIKIPAGALFRHGGGWHTYRIIDGTAHAQPVRIGMTDGLETEILEGLSPGDVVVLYPTDKVAEGVRLKTTVTPGAADP